MSIRSIQRRLGNLEFTMGDTLIPEYPPLTLPEADAIARRVQLGGKFTKTELDRLEQHSPIVEGELLMTCHRRHLTVKRYVGVDLAII